MRHALLAIGLIFLILAGVFHVYIFKLESINWLKPKTWKTFGLPSQEVAQVIQPMAFNQGFYNLFLAFGILLGAVVTMFDETIGFTLMLFAGSSMVCAGVVLFLSSNRSRRAALLQASPPLFGIVLTVIGLVSK